MEYRVEFKLAVDNHEAEYFKMAHLKGEELKRARDRICGILGEYAPHEEPSGSLYCEPCQPTMPECGECGMKKLRELDEEEQAEPAPAAETPAAPAPEPEQVTEWVPGYKGIIRMVCQDCKKSFVNFYKERVTEERCRECGKTLEMNTGTMARFDFDCPSCGRHTYGYTNDANPEFDDFRCTCGTPVRLIWNGAEKRYVLRGLR